MIRLKLKPMYAISFNHSLLSGEQALCTIPSHFWLPIVYHPFDIDQAEEKFFFNFHFIWEGKKKLTLELKLTQNPCLTYEYYRDDMKLHS